MRRNDWLEEYFANQWAFFGLLMIIACIIFAGQIAGIIPSTANATRVPTVTPTPRPTKVAQKAAVTPTVAVLEQGYLFDDDALISYHAVTWVEGKGIDGSIIVRRPLQELVPKMVVISDRKGEHRIEAELMTTTMPERWFFTAHPILPGENRIFVAFDRPDIFPLVKITDWFWIQ